MIAQWTICLLVLGTRCDLGSNSGVDTGFFRAGSRASDVLSNGNIGRKSRSMKRATYTFACVKTAFDMDGCETRRRPSSC